MSIRIRYPAPIERLIEEARWSFAEHLYEKRLSYQELAEANTIHRATARRSTRRREAFPRYGCGDDPTPTCNEVEKRCQVCEIRFTASRGDVRYCSNACRQGAYRKRKLETRDAA